MADFELSRTFAVALADVLGLSTKGLLSFSVEIGSDEFRPAVVVAARYVVPKGAGEAAATLIRRHNFVQAEMTEAGGESIDASTPLMSDVETVHRNPATERPQ